VEDLHLGYQGILTGDPTVDRQHEEIIRRANSLRTAIQEGRGAADIAELLAFLDDYTTLHFTSEEALMAKVGYPNLGAHRREHAGLLAPIRSLEREFRIVGPTPAMVEQLNRVLWTRFIQHVLKSDMAFAAYARDHQAGGKRAASAR